MTRTMQKQKTGIVTYAVFIFALVVVMINITSLFFPSLLVSLIDESGFIEDPFEPGPWIIPILAVNIFLLALGILYYTRKLPKFIRKSIDFIFNFELSHNVTIFVVVIVLFFYVGSIMTESMDEEGIQFGDFERVQKIVEAWPNSAGQSQALEILHVKISF